MAICKVKGHLTAPCCLAQSPKLGLGVQDKPPSGSDPTETPFFPASSGPFERVRPCLLTGISEQDLPDLAGPSLGPRGNNYLLSCSPPSSYLPSPPGSWVPPAFNAIVITAIHSYCTLHGSPSRLRPGFTEPSQWDTWEGGEEERWSGLGRW